MEYINRQEKLYKPEHDNLQYDLYDQQRLRSACTSTQYGYGSRSSLFE